jgi:hypothetical protein
MNIYNKGWSEKLHGLLLPIIIPGSVRYHTFFQTNPHKNDNTYFKHMSVYNIYSFFKITNIFKIKLYGVLSETKPHDVLGVTMFHCQQFLTFIHKELTVQMHQILLLIRNFKTIFLKVW